MKMREIIKKIKVSVTKQSIITKISIIINNLGHILVIQLVYWLILIPIIKLSQIKNKIVIKITIKIS